MKVIHTKYLDINVAWIPMPEFDEDNRPEQGQPEINQMSEFKNYKRKGVAKMRAYVPGEGMNEISVSAPDKALPTEEFNKGFIARNPNNPEDQWYVSRKYFEENFESEGSTGAGRGVIDRPFPEGRTLSFGEKAVGYAFNPSGNPEVNVCKKGFADLIDQMNDFRSITENQDAKRHASVAITEMEGAQMRAVKALTTK